MKLKSIIYILGIIFAVGILLILPAEGQERKIKVGQVYTQEEIDTFDFNAIDLELKSKCDDYRIVAVKDNELGNELRIECPYSVLSLEKFSNETGIFYLGIEEELKSSFLYYGEFKHCETENNNPKEKCKLKMKDKIIEQQDNGIEEMRGKLKFFQTIQIPPENWREFLR